MYYRGWYWFAGHDPASLNRQCGARTPSFFFVREKEKKGCGRGTGANSPRGHAPQSNAKPDRHETSSYFSSQTASASLAPMRTPF